MNGEAKFQGQRQDLGEDLSTYQARMDRYARLTLLIDLNSGTPASTLARQPQLWHASLNSGTPASMLFDCMNPYRKEACFEAEAGQGVDEPIAHRQPEFLLVLEMLKDSSRWGGSHSSDDSPTLNKPNWLSVARRMPHPSFSASNFGGEARISFTEDSANQATKKTDNLVQQIIQDAMLNSVLAGELSSMKVPFKLLPPVFKGMDSIEEFLSFTKGLVNYLAIHGYMKPEMDSIRVCLLGHILTDKALRWFQQAINYGVDNQWSFEDTMVSLKRHFVKDTSARDAARKFEQLEQKS